MEAREEIETYDHRGRGLRCNRLDGVLDHGHEDDSSENLGSLQHTRHLKGKAIQAVAWAYS